MLQIALCDDNIDDLSNMVQLIDLYRVSRNFSCEYAAFQNGLELIAILEKGKRFDIYCLDIMMPGFTGMDAAKEIRGYDKTAPVLFFTSSTEFAFESYSVKAINYILKPVTKEKFFFYFDELLEQIKTEKGEDAITVKSNEGIQKFGYLIWCLPRLMAERCCITCALVRSLNVRNLFRLFVIRS